MARQFICKKDYPVVQTEAGKLRGCVLDGTFIFHGIKYADAKRFQMPEKVKSWEGIKDALSYGMCCPMLQQDRPNGEHMVPHRYWPMDEHCQYLNIWTQSIDPNAKKPVMVWFHGGGFEAGSSIEQVAYDGTNLSKYGDVVVVTLNHRLNILGYMDLSSFGEKYKHSANAGNADMIAALEWVRDNIAGFGGDPENVTIFGQSGGGAKVWSLLQMPSADGLYHKGIIQSGVLEILSDHMSGDHADIVNAMLEELGLTADDVEELEKIPYAKLAEVYGKVFLPIMKRGGYVGKMPTYEAGYYEGEPRYYEFRKETAHIPLMVGSTMGEFAFMPEPDNKYEITRDEAIAMAKEHYIGDAEKIVDLFAQVYPQRALSDSLVVDALFREPQMEFIAKRVENPESKVYSYLFTYEFPVDSGKVAWHCSEIPFVFHNTELVPVCNKEGVSDELEEKISGAWISFAKTGKPEIKGLEWPASKPGDEANMILDEVCEVRHNHDHELVHLCGKNAKPFTFDFEEIQH